MLYSKLFHTSNCSYLLYKNIFYLINIFMVFNFWITKKNEIIYTCRLIADNSFRTHIYNYFPREISLYLCQKNLLHECNCLQVCVILYIILTHNGIYFIYLSNLKSGDENTRVLRVKHPGVKHPGGVKSKHHTITQFKNLKIRDLLL
jgi:hypothetical protein